MGSQIPSHFPCWCRGIYDWTGETEDDLPAFEPGDVIECFEAGDDGAWWTGRLWRNGVESEPGIFPSNFVSLISDEEGESAKYESSLPPPPFPTESAALEADLPYEVIQTPIEEEPSIPYAPPSSALQSHDVAPLRNRSKRKSKSSASSKPQDYRTHLPRSLSPGPPSRFAVDIDEEEDEGSDDNEHYNAAIGRSQSLSTYTPRDTYANASSGYANDLGVSHNSKRSHSKRASKRQDPSPAMSPMTPGASSTAAPYYQNGSHLPPSPLTSPAWSQSMPSIPYVESDPVQETGGDFGPPPPPPPHRIVFNKVRNRPYTQEFSTPIAEPIHEEDSAEEYAETEQTPEPYRSHDSPSPFRDALEDVIDSLNGMGLGIDTGQSKLDAAELGFEHDHYRPESQQSQSQLRPRKTKTKGIVQQEGPPQLGNYVQRMESHLKGLQSPESHSPSMQRMESQSHGIPPQTHSPSMQMMESQPQRRHPQGTFSPSMRKQSDELHITPKSTPNLSRPSSRAKHSWDRDFDDSNMFPQPSWDRHARPASSLSALSSARTSRLSRYYGVNQPARPQSRAF